MEPAYFIGPTSCEAVWDISVGTPGFDDWVNVLGVFDLGQGERVYAGGQFHRAGTAEASGIAQWDGHQWARLGTGIGGHSTAGVLAMAVHDDGTGPALFVGGTFTTAGSRSAKYLAKWDGQFWSEIGSFRGKVWAFATFDDGSGSKLVASGHFSHVDDVEIHGIAIWDGISWQALPVPFGLGDAFELAVFDDGSGPALFVAGRFEEAGGVSADNIAKWDGTVWAPVGGGITGVNGFVGSLAVLDDGSGPALYAGGRFSFAGGLPVRNLAKWDGMEWADVGGGVDGSVRTMAMFDDGSGTALFVGGVLSEAGTTPVNHIAKYDGQQWSALGTGINMPPPALLVANDGHGEALFVAGRFDEAGGQPAERIAKWWCIDCNGNGILDATDVAQQTSPDCDANLVPDECDPDCDFDGVPDGCEIDTDFDSVPDDCDACPGEDDLLDTDADGVSDCQDPCPLDDPDDQDGDGVCDSNDLCPRDSQKSEPGICGCGFQDHGICPTPVYSATRGERIYPVGSTATVVDDLRLAAIDGCQLRRYEILVSSSGDGSGPAFSVDVALYDGWPFQGGQPIAGTERHVELPDDGIHPVVVDTDVWIPERVWLSVTFSDAYGRWFYGVQPETGASEGIFGKSNLAHFGNPQNPDNFEAFHAKLFCSDAPAMRVIAYDATRAPDVLIVGDGCPSGRVESCEELESKELSCDAMADGITPVISNCRLSAYDLGMSSAPSSVVPEVSAQLWTDAGDNLGAHTRPASPIPGTECCLTLLDGQHRDAGCTLDGSVELPDRFWVSAADGSSRVGHVSSELAPTVGQNADCLSVYGDPSTGEWSDCTSTNESCDLGSRCTPFIFRLWCLDPSAKGSCCFAEAGITQCVDSIAAEQCAGDWHAGGICDADADGDGVDSGCGDECPDDPNKSAPGICGCGVSDDDTDGDGVADCFDQCPGEDDIPDSDTDGVLDCLDLCEGLDDTVDEDADGTPDCLDAIPVVSEWGLVIMALLLLTTWKVYSFRAGQTT